MRQRARDAQKILKMLPQQQSRQRRRNSTNVLGKEWVSWSSNETAKKSSSAPLASSALHSSHPSRQAAGLFFLCPLPLAGIFG